MPADRDPTPCPACRLPSRDGLGSVRTPSRLTGPVEARLVRGPRDRRVQAYFSRKFTGLIFPARKTCGATSVSA